MFPPEHAVPEPGRLHSDMPERPGQGCAYFITFCTTFRQKLTTQEIQLVMGHLLSGRGRYYQLHAAVVMPYHVHALLAPERAYSLERLIAGLKGSLARRLNRYRGQPSRIRVWQQESYDRPVRDSREYHRIERYMYYNPVLAGLTNNPDKYCGWYGGGGIRGQGTGTRD